MAQPLKHSVKLEQQDSGLAFLNIRLEGDLTAAAANPITNDVQGQVDAGGDPGRGEDRVAAAHEPLAADGQVAVRLGLEGGVDGVAAGVSSSGRGRWPGFPWPGSTNGRSG